MTEKPRWIHRAAKDEGQPYFIMSRKVAQDSRLSWEARGLFAYLLSQEKLVDLYTLGDPQWVQAIYEELQRCGYLESSEDDPS